MQFYTYILLCADNTLYTGSTNNLEKRMHEHNTAKNGAHYTKIRRPVTLIYSESFNTLGEARSRESAIKRMAKSEKLALIETK
jgi:putative endonuclease